MNSTSALLEYDVRFSLKENQKQKKKIFIYFLETLTKVEKGIENYDMNL